MTIIKVCYLDMWCDAEGSPRIIEKINNIDVWNNSHINNRYYIKCDIGVGLVHIHEFQKYLNVELVTDADNADLIICSCFGNDKFKYPNKKKIFLGYESICNQQTFTNLPKTLYISNYSQVTHHNQIYLNLYFLYSGLNILQQLTIQRPLSMTKSKFCLSIISNHSQPFRQNFIQQLMKKKHIDNYGRVNRNCYDPIISNTTWFDPRILSQINQYKFMICFENQSIPGYHTEKIINGFLGRTVPIYWGDPDIGKHFNTNAFIDVTKLGTEAAIELIMRLDTDQQLYQQYYDHIPIINTQVLNNDEFRGKIKDFVLS